MMSCHVSDHFLILRPVRAYQSFRDFLISDEVKIRVYFLLSTDFRKMASESEGFKILTDDVLEEFFERLADATAELVSTDVLLFSFSKLEAMNINDG